ncbi:metallophosphoesterase [Pelagicoccus albus]|uniref:Metallophosphoesterase n=2 Tax=Pelagicoccus albus TaxID=415222 RepID=A0A7X1B4C2_9BACT|nr:metallophosphoesterase [Pelagicoccus albus]MBC2605397.1 metallophosphoesterase [Pelagicoccus albus]
MAMLLIPIILGLINYYLFRVAAAAYPGLSVFFATAIILLFLSLFVAIFLEKRGKLAASLPFSWIGYTWLGITCIAFSLSALSDLVQLITVSFNDRAQFLFVLISTVGLSLWAAFDAKRVRLRKIRLRSPKISNANHSLRIVQISDLHLGDSSSIAHTRKLVDTINQQKPDIVVSTGDLFDGYLELMAPFVDALRKIEAPLGKFAVSGNHEVYAGLDQALSLTELAGFSVLRNGSFPVNSQLTVVGVEDPASEMKPDEESALSTLSRLPFHLLLKHRPAFDPESAGKFDLQLSGHTHGGQIAPFHLLTKLAYRAKPGLTELASHQHLYLSRGTGAWGPQLRLFAPPEIAVFDLTAG